MCFRVKTTQNDGEGHIWGTFFWLGDTKMIYNKSVVFSVKISDEVANTIHLWSWQSHACFSMFVAGNFAGYWFTSALQCHIRHTPLTDIHLPWEAEDSIAGWESQSPWDTWRKQIWGISPPYSGHWARKSQAQSARHENENRYTTLWSWGRN